MPGVIRIITLASVIATIGCGATTSGSSGSTNAPVYTPPRSGAPSTTANTAPTEVNGNDYGVIPAGQELDVRLGTTLSSKTAKVEQRFDATTVADLTQNGRVLIPAGSTVRGVVAAVDPADRLHRAGSLTLSLILILVVIFELSGIQNKWRRQRDQVPKKPLGLDT